MTIQLNSATGTITVDSGALNFTGLAASTWQLTAGALTLTAAGGITLTSGLTLSGTSPLLVTSSGAHRFSGGDLSLDTAVDFGSAGAVTAVGNPTFNFGTARSTFGGPVDIVGALTLSAGVLLTELVEAKTITYAVLAGDSGKTFTNEGSAGVASARPFNLPTAAAGLRYTFYNQVGAGGSGSRIVAAAGDTLRIAAAVSAAAGQLDSAAVGDSVTVVAINATEWVATSTQGTWTVT